MNRKRSGERTKAATPPRKPRQTQDARRDATRQRILEATLYCLAKYGYAGTGVAQVVAKAKVSRGAWAHHFPSMNAMIAEAAEYLLVKVYQRLAGTMLKVAISENRVEALIHTAWHDFFASDVNEIYLELLIASRRNAELSRKLRALSSKLEGRLGDSANMFFQAVPGTTANVTEMLHFARWVMRGIALDAPLMPEGGVERALEALSRFTVSQIKQR